MYYKKVYKRLLISFIIETRSFELKSTHENGSTGIRIHSVDIFNIYLAYQRLQCTLYYVTNNNDDIAHLCVGNVTSESAKILIGCKS